jgi:hypothetical protein
MGATSRSPPKVTHRGRCQADGGGGVGCSITFISAGSSRARVFLLVYLVVSALFGLIFLSLI